MNNFQSLLLSNRLRTVIDKLPVIPASHLETEPEWRRAYSMLTFMAHGYIWGGEKPSEVSVRGGVTAVAVLTIRAEITSLNHLPSPTSVRTP